MTEEGKAKGALHTLEVRNALIAALKKSDPTISQEALAAGFAWAIWQLNEGMPGIALRIAALLVPDDTQ